MNLSNHIFFISVVVHVPEMLGKEPLDTQVFVCRYLLRLLPPTKSISNSKTYKSSGVGIMFTEYVTGVHTSTSPTKLGMSGCSNSPK